MFIAKSLLKKKDKLGLFQHKNKYMIYYYYILVNRVGLKIKLYQ